MKELLKINDYIHVSRFLLSVNTNGLDLFNLNLTFIVCLEFFKYLNFL